MGKIFKTTSRLFDRTVDKMTDLKRRIEEIKNEAHKEENGRVRLKAEKSDGIRIDISVESVVRATLAILGIALAVYLVYTLKSIVVLIFVSLMISAALSPFVDHLEKIKIPRALSVILVYFVILVIFALVIYSLVPLVSDQLITLANNIKGIVENVLSNREVDIPFLGERLRAIIEKTIQTIDKETLASQLQNIFNAWGSQLQNIAKNSFVALAAIFNGIFNAALVLVLTFFMVTDKAAIKKFLKSLLPHRYSLYFSLKTVALQEKIGAWVRGQLLLILSVAITTYLGLWILSFLTENIEYKETLAVLAGIFEIIPVIGPVLGAVPAVLIAANLSPWMILWVVILYIIIQQLENNILVPMIMNRAVGISPLVIVMAMLIGAQLFGILGVIFAIPVMTAISVFVRDYTDREK